MDNQKRKKILWWAIIALVIIGLIFLIWSLLQQRAANNPKEEEEYIPPKIDMPSADLEYQEIAPSVAEAEFQAITLAKTYAERFGSWSTDSAGHNLAELAPKSTARMKNYLNSIEANTQAEYSGITTRSLATETLSISDTEAMVTVSTQRTQTKADLSTDIYYQDIEITLIKSGDTWLVDSAYWQE